MTERALQSAVRSVWSTSMVSSRTRVTAVVGVIWMALLSATSVQPGARPALLTLSAVVGTIGLLGVRVIHAKSLVTPWLLLGPLPALLGWLATR